MQKLMMCPPKPKVSETLPHPVHGLDVSTNHPHTVVNNNWDSMWSQEIMGNAFYYLPAQNPGVPAFFLLGHSEHFWLLPMEPTSVLGLKCSTDVKQCFRDLLAAWHIRSQ